jgi:hypothetical protein
MLAAAVPPNGEVLYLIAANQRCVNRIHEALETLPPGATASAVQPHLPGARLLLHDPAGCAARDRCLSARRGHQPGAGDELEHARTPVSPDGG